MKNKKVIIFIVPIILILIVIGYLLVKNLNNSQPVKVIETPKIVNLTGDLANCENIKFSVDQDKYPHITGDVLNSSLSSIYIDTITIKTLDSAGAIIKSVTSDIKQSIESKETIPFDANIPLNNATVKCDVYGYKK
jgi:uncharacterized protein YpmB